MNADTSTPSASVSSLLVIAVSALGPVIGPYAVIFAGAVAGALWPLNMAKTQTTFSAFMLMLRCVSLSIFLTVMAANYFQKISGIPIDESIGAVALVIAALGNGWGPVINALSTALSSAVSKLTGASEK